MKTFLKLYILCTLIALVACEDKEEPIEERQVKITGRGEIVSESEIVNPFTKIDLQNVSNVYVETGKERKIVLTAYENIVPYMEATVVDDELILRFNSDISISSDEEIKVEITVPELEQVTLSGVGNFYISGPSQRSFTAHLDGVGNIYAFDLPVLYGSVDIAGNGNVEIDAKEALDVDIDGLGNVYYKGNPELNIDIDGLGDVVAE